MASHLGLFLVFGLLAGALLGNPALGVLGGLICHLMVTGLSRRNHAEKTNK